MKSSAKGYDPGGCNAARPICLKRPPGEKALMTKKCKRLLDEKMTKNCKQLLDEKIVDGADYVPHERLKRPPGEKGEKALMVKKCKQLLDENIVDGADYVPHKRIQELLAYEQGSKIIDKRFKKKDKNDEEENCYAFDTAWLAVIKDVIHRVENMKETYNIESYKIDSTKESNNPPKPQIDDETADKLLEVMKEDMKKNTIDLLGIFTNIYEVAKKKWNCNDDNVCNSDTPFPENNDIASAIMRGFDRLIGDTGFIDFCNIMNGTQEQGEEEQEQVEKEGRSSSVRSTSTRRQSQQAPAVQQAPALQQASAVQQAPAASELTNTQMIDSLFNDIFKQVELLFKYVMVIMNPAADLTNAIREIREKITIEKIEKMNITEIIAEDFSTIISLFNAEEAAEAGAEIKGGGKVGNFFRGVGDFFWNNPLTRFLRLLIADFIGLILYVTIDLPLSAVIGLPHYLWSKIPIIGGPRLFIREYGMFGRRGRKIMNYNNLLMMVRKEILIILRCNNIRILKNDEHCKILVDNQKERWEKRKRVKEANLNRPSRFLGNRRIVVNPEGYGRAEAISELDRAREERERPLKEERARALKQERDEAAAAAAKRAEFKRYLDALKAGLNEPPPVYPNPSSLPKYERSGAHPYVEAPYMDVNAGNPNLPNRQPEYPRAMQSSERRRFGISNSEYDRQVLDLLKTRQAEEEEARLKELDRKEPGWREIERVRGIVGAMERRNAWNTPSPQEEIPQSLGSSYNSSNGGGKTLKRKQSIKRKAVRHIKRTTVKRSKHKRSKHKRSKHKRSIKKKPK